jgi:hypothetical protein
VRVLGRGEDTSFDDFDGTLASLPSGLAATGTVRVDAGEEAVLDLGLPRGLALTGRLSGHVLAAGEPAAGNYRVTAETKGFSPASHTIVVTPGGTADLRVVLEPEARP